MAKEQANVVGNASTLKGWDFPVTLVEEVPLIRTQSSQALPINWKFLADTFLEKGKSPTITVPFKFWTEQRGLNKDEAKDERIKTSLKNSFTGYRQQAEKAAGKMLPIKLGIATVRENGDAITGHQLYIMHDDVTVRAALVERMKAAQKKAKKPTRKTAAGSKGK